MKKKETRGGTRKNAGAINNWARKDDLIGKLKFDVESPENKNRPAPPPPTIKYN